MRTVYTVVPNFILASLLFVGVFAFPFAARAAIVATVGDLNNPASWSNSISAIEFSLLYNASPDVYTLGGIRFAAAWNSDVSVRIRAWDNNGTPTAKDCQTEYFLPSSIMPQYDGSGGINPTYSIVELNFTGTQCNVNAGAVGYPSNLYMELESSPGSQDHNAIYSSQVASGPDASRFPLQISDTPFPPPVPPDTRITTVTPPGDFPPDWLGARATSTTFAIENTGTVSDDDYKTGIIVRQTIWNEAQKASILAVSLLAFYQERTVQRTFNYDVTSAGDFAFATTTDIQQVGVYSMQTQILTPVQFLGINTGLYDPLYATSTRFLVATTTVYDALAQNSSNSLAEAMSAADAANQCTDWSDPTQLDQCIMHLFIPNAEDIQGTVDVLHDQVLIKAPWGYATLVADIFLAPTTATTTLPSFALDVSTMVPGTSGTLDLTPWNELAGPTSLLATREIPQTGNHPLDKMLEDWNTFCWIAMGVWFVTRFFGAWQKGTFGGPDHSSLTLKEEAKISVSASRWGGGKGVIH